MHIEPGAQARELRVVAESDTAQALGTGEVPVLASSRLFAWCEAASLAVLEPVVPPGSTSVAMRVNMDHIRAASVGCSITATATLERIEGRRYVFVVSAVADDGPSDDAETGDDQAQASPTDTNQEIANGRIVRVVVDKAEFLAKACRSGE